MSARAIRITAILVLIFMMQGCSFFAVYSIPDNWEKGQELDCTSYVFPSVDVALGLAMAGGTATVFALGLGEQSGVTGYWGSDLALGITGIFLTSMVFLSSISGYISTYRCHAAAEANEKWHLENK